MSGALEGRAALITGGARGLGLEIARAYLREGARIVICARSVAALAAAQEELAAAGEVHAHAADVSVPEAAQELVAFAAEKLGGLDILVNNAGVYGPKGAIDEVVWAQWVRAIEINLMGSVLPARFALGHLRQSERGKIVQLSGGGATSPLPMLSAYAASKAAIVRFAETLAHEVADDGIDVNAIAPGALNTTMLDEVLEAGPEAVGEAFYAKAVRATRERRHALDARREPRRLPRLAPQRRHHRPPAERGLGSVGGARAARRHAARQRHLHLAQDRPGRARPGLGRARLSGRALW